MATIRKRKKKDGGGYQVRYYGPDGRRHSKTLPTREAAVDFSNRVEVDLSRDAWVDPAVAKTPLRDYVAGYLETSVHWRHATRIKVQGHIDNYILPAFGDYPIGTIRPTDIREFVVALFDHGLAPGTVRAIYFSLSRVMRQAVVDGLVIRSPCIGVSLPQDVVQRELRFLDASQVEALAHALDDRYRVLIYTAAYTGLRWSELSALKVANVDLIAGTIKVVEAAVEVKGIRHEGPTKTGAKRTVSMPRFLIQMLSEHLTKYPSNGYLFTSAKDRPLRHNFYQRYFVRAVAQAKLPKGFRFHDLRHTCAALLIAQGAHPKEIQERLGHSTIAVTFDRYGHLFPSLDERLRDGLEETYQRGRRNASPDR